MQWGRVEWRFEIPIWKAKKAVAICNLKADYFAWAPALKPMGR